MVDEEGREEKLKELEKNLAQQLDPQVDGSGEEGSAQGDSEKVKGAGAKGGGTSQKVGGGSTKDQASSSDGEVSLENLDDLVGDGAESKATSDAEELASLGPTTLGDSSDRGPDREHETKAQKTIRLLKAPIFWPAQGAEKLYDFIDGIVQADWKARILRLREWLEKGLGFLKSKVGIFTGVFKSGIGWFRRLSTLGKVELIGFVLVTLVAATYFFSLTVGKLRVSWHGKEFLNSFEEIADSITPFGEEARLEQWDSPLRNPEFSVLIRRMVVNLKFNPRERARPMAAMELYLEASSREGAMEIQDRMSEVRDILSRVCEETDFKDIQTAEGKKKLKRIMRRDLNAILNNGRVKRVRFKTFFYKP